MVDEGGAVYAGLCAGCWVCGEIAAALLLGGGVPAAAKAAMYYITALRVFLASALRAMSEWIENVYPTNYAPFVTVMSVL